MAFVIDLEESKNGAWFDIEGGGKVKLRSLDADDWRAIRRQTVKKGVDYKKIDGTPCRLPYEDTNDDLQNELVWDCCIMAWENFLDVKGNEIPCTKENKVLLMSKSTKFAKFVADSLKQIQDDEAKEKTASEKN